MLKGLSINGYLCVFFISLLSVSSSIAGALVGNKGTKEAGALLMSTNKPPIFRGVQPVFTFTAGASISQLGQPQSFMPLDLCRYNYKPQGSMTNMLWGGFIGSEVKRSSSWGLIVGLGYYQPTRLSTKGTLTQGADLESDNAYNYRYQTQSQQLLVEGKLYWIAKERIQPFVMLGIGPAWNKTSHYQTNVPPFLEFTPEFSSHTQTNFTYAVGSGVDVSLTQAFRVGVGYRFTDVGSANTGSAQIDEIPISSTLKQRHLYANQVLVQFTFIPWSRD
ncbi:MAG: outer membrane beta-barrel protein [Legionellaceae bacterium]|nr:outer membrane beta-barrel protein [Legionellaceae bacterium]